MQIMKTHVAHGAMPMVEFLGEGSERIAVTLAQSGALSDQELIAKAKVMLLHAATLNTEYEGGGPS